MFHNPGGRQAEPWQADSVQAGNGRCRNGRQVAERQAGMVHPGRQAVMRQGQKQVSRHSSRYPRWQTQAQQAVVAGRRQNVAVTPGGRTQATPGI